MENLKNFLAIIGLIKLIKNSYNYIQKVRKNPNELKQDLRNLFYHVNSIKYLAAFLILSSLVIVYFNGLVSALIYLKYELTIKGFNLASLFFVIATAIPIFYFYKMHKNHLREIKLINPHLRKM